MESSTQALAQGLWRAAVTTVPPVWDSHMVSASLEKSRKKNFYKFSFVFLASDSTWTNISPAEVFPAEEGEDLTFRCVSEWERNHRGKKVSE